MRSNLALFLWLTACGDPAAVVAPGPPPAPPTQVTVFFQNQQNFNVTLELGGKAYPPFGGPFFAGYFGPSSGAQLSACRWVLDTGLARHGLEIVVDREAMNSAGDWYYLSIRDTVLAMRPTPGWSVTVLDSTHVAIIPSTAHC